MAGGSHRLALANADGWPGQQLGQRAECKLCQRLAAAHDERQRLFPAGLSVMGNPKHPSHSLPKFWYFVSPVLGIYGKVLTVKLSQSPARLKFVC